MKKYLIIFAICLFIKDALWAQTTSSAIYITETYSPNGNFYIKCVPYDNEVPSLKGRSYVYNKQDELIYTIDRGFNDLDENRDHILLSNDGTTIAYVIAVRANEKVDGLKSVSIYQKGKLVRSYTQMEITGCDPQNERCSLVYSNYDKIVDFDKSGLGTKNFHKTFKDNTSDEEFFLNEHAVLQADDHLYITDPNKIVHIIDLKTADTIGTVAFDTIYQKLKGKQNGITNYQQFETPYSKTKSWFPNLINGDITANVLAKHLGLQVVDLGPDYAKYKVYQIHIEAYISRDGTIDVQKLTADKKLPLDTVTRFFKNNKYDVSFLPVGIDKWYFHDFFCAFRNPSDEQALLEKQQDDKEKLLEREKRMTMDSISGVYIPRNLEECFIQLDKILPNVTKTEIKSLKSKSDIGLYHFTLGMWIRNNWGLWGGSRLLKYFQDRASNDWVRKNPNPDRLSSIILSGYYDWLKGDKNIGKKWEEKNPAH